MAFNLSKGERFNLSKSADTPGADITHTTSQQTTPTAATKNGTDQAMLPVLIVTGAVLVVNACLWYYVVST